MEFQALASAEEVAEAIPGAEAEGLLIVERRALMYWLAAAHGEQAPKAWAEVAPLFRAASILAAHDDVAVVTFGLAAREAAWYIELNWAEVGVLVVAFILFKIASSWANKAAGDDDGTADLFEDAPATETMVNVALTISARTESVRRRIMVTPLWVRSTTSVSFTVIAEVAAPNPLLRALGDSVRC